MVDPEERLHAVITCAETARRLLLSEDSDTALSVYRRALAADSDDPWETALWHELRDMILQAALFIHSAGGPLIIREFDARLARLRAADVRASVTYWLRTGLDRDAASAAAALHRPT